MTEFRFALAPALFLLVLPLVVWIARRNQGGRQSSLPVMRYSDTRLLMGLAEGWRVRWRRVPDVLRLVVWVLLIIALARPQTGRGQEIVRGEGIAIVLALDISGSMASLDFQPDNRLAAAKRVIADFIAGRSFDRIGLVVFARDAFQQVPPTLDYTTLLRLLDEVRLITELGLEDGTALGLGIASAGNMLRDSEARSKVIILLTDGANNAGLDPITAANAVRALGMRIYTIGMGRPGSTELNEDVLRDIVTFTGGLYFRAEDTTGLQQIYDRINTLVQSDVTRQIFVRWQDQVVPWMLAALGLLVVERLLRHSVFQSIP